MPPAPATEAGDGHAFAASALQTGAGVAARLEVPRRLLRLTAKVDRRRGSGRTGAGPHVGSR
jgi:hypothetical protein